MDKAILIWNFGDAPEKYRKLSPYNGNEAWIAYIPAGFTGFYPIPFRADYVTPIQLSDGAQLRIGANV